MARLSFRCDEELVRRVDEARGMVPRETWLRSIVSGVVGGAAVTRDSVDEVNAVPAPAEQPDEEAREVDRLIGVAHELRTREAEREVYRQHVPGPNVENVRSSSQSKRDVRPVPKGGK